MCETGWIIEKGWRESEREFSIELSLIFKGWYQMLLMALECLKELVTTKSSVKVIYYHSIDAFFIHYNEDSHREGNN